MRSGRPGTPRGSSSSLRAQLPVHRLAFRALDWALSADSPPEAAVGNAIVSWLLADDRYARARMGVQEIAWHRRVWTSARWRGGLRTIHHGDRRRRWIHIALTWAGARLQTSYWH